MIAAQYFRGFGQAELCPIPSTHRVVSGARYRGSNSAPFGSLHGFWRASNDVLRKWCATKESGWRRNMQGRVRCNPGGLFAIRKGNGIRGARSRGGKQNAIKLVWRCETAKNSMAAKSPSCLSPRNAYCGSNSFATVQNIYRKHSDPLTIPLDFHDSKNW